MRRPRLLWRRARCPTTVHVVCDGGRAHVPGEPRPRPRAQVEPASRLAWFGTLGAAWDPGQHGSTRYAQVDPGQSAQVDRFQDRGQCEDLLPQLLGTAE